MSNCEKVFLDKDGLRSDIYYKNENGTDLYIKSMLGILNTSFQKQSFEELKDVNKLFDSRPELFNKPGFKGAKKTIAGSQNTFDEIEVAGQIAKRLKAKDLIEEDPKKYGKTRKEILDAKYNSESFLTEISLEDANKYFENNRGEFEKAISDIRASWKYSTDEGIENHDTIRKYVNLRNKYRAEGDYNPTKIIEEILSTSKDAVEDKRLLEQVEKFIHNVTSKMKNYEITAEMKIQDEELKVNGILDLVIHDKDSNILYVYDWKFKQKGKEFLFDTRTLGRLNAPFDGLFNNRETEGALQLSMYKLILERKGFSNINTFLVPVIGEPDIDTKGNIINYRNIEITKPRPTVYYRSELGKLFKTTGKDINKVKLIEADKDNTPKDLIQNISNGRFDVSNRDIDREVAKILNDIKVDVKTGKEYYFNKVLDKLVYFKPDTTEKEKAEEIKQYLKKLHNDTDRLANDLISFFNTKALNKDAKWPANYENSYTEAKQRQANNILASINPEEYRLQQLKNIFGYEDADPNLLIAIHKVTNDAKLFFITDKADYELKFDSNRTTVFGNYLADKTIKSTYNINGLKSNLSNYKILEAALWSLELKKDSYINNIESITFGTINGNVNRSGEPVVNNMSNLLPQIKVLKDITKETQSKYIADLLNNSTLNDLTNYKTRHFSNLIELLDNANNFTILNRNNMRSEIKNVYQAFTDNNATNLDVLNILYDAQKQMYDSLKANSKNPIELARNKEYAILCEAILDIANIKLDQGAIGRKREALHGFTITSNTNDPILQQVYTLDQTTQQHASRKFFQFKKEHSQLVKELMDEAGINLEKISTADLYKVFTPLFIEDPNNEIKDPSNAFILKDLNDSTLKPAQKKYIEFFNNHIKKGYDMIMTDEQIKAFNANKNWENGMVPLLLASDDNKTSRVKNFKAKVNIYLESFKHKGVKNTQQVMEEIFFNLNNTYLSQLGSYGVQKSDVRRKLLGIDESGNKIDDTKNFLETNLEHILNNFYAESLISATYQPTFAIYNALQVKLILEKEENFINTDEQRKLLIDYVKFQISNEYNDDGKFGRVMDIGNKVLTDLTLGLSPKQVVLETMTNLVTGHSVALQSFIAQVTSSKDAFLKKPSSWYSANKWTLGSKVGESKQISLAIQEQYGVYNADLTAFGNKELQASKKSNLFQSKSLYFLNNLAFKEYRSQMLFAKLIDDGSITGYSFENGQLVYDVKKDDRFKDIFDSNGRLKTNLSDKEKDKYAFYLSLIKDLKNEPDGILENGLPARPYSSKEILVIKDYMMRSFGSMDRDAKIAFQASVWGRLFFKFKNWFAVKAGNYWSKGELKSAKGRRVKITPDPSKPEEFYYEFNDQWHEGIIQTLYQMYIQVADAIKQEGVGNFYKGFNFDDESGLGYGAARKENLRRLIADMLICLSYYMLFSVLSNTDAFKNPQGKYLLSIANNSLGDLNFFKSSDSIINGNPVSLYNFITKSITHVKDVVVYSATGDFDTAIKSGSQMTGMTKSLYNLVQ